MPESQVAPIFYFLGGAGSILIAIGLILLIRTLLFSARSLRAEGTVIDLEENNDDDGVTYSAIVRFAAQDGREITFTDSISTRPAMFKVGEQVRVFYLPDDYKRARIAKPFRLILIPLVMLSLGGILVGVAWWWSRR